MLGSVFNYRFSALEVSKGQVDWLKGGGILFRKKVIWPQCGGGIRGDALLPQK